MPLMTMPHTVRRAHQPKLYRPDRMGIVGFHDNAFVIARPAEAHAAWLQERTLKLHEKIGGSGTNITDALRVSYEMLKAVPRGIYRRVWLLSDGEPNRDVDQLMNVVGQLRDDHINLNTIAFGDSCDEALLRRLSGATHNGKFVSVQNLNELTEALAADDASRDYRNHHRSETTIFAIDASPSMTEPMNGMRKIDVVEIAMLQLLNWKQHLYA
jgi:Mg-chelatase subunit ChlD